jgi:hypothetical protein
VRDGTVSLQQFLPALIQAGAVLVAVKTVPSKLAPVVVSDDFRLSRLGGRHGTERDKPVAEETLMAGTGRCLLAMAGAQLKEVPEFVVTPAKATRGDGVSEPAHRTISALDPAKILFDSVVEIPAGPVLHTVTQHRPDGAWVTVMAVRPSTAPTTRSRRSIE